MINNNEDTPVNCICICCILMLISFYSYYGRVPSFTHAASTPTHVPVRMPTSTPMHMPSFSLHSDTGTKNYYSINLNFQIVTK